MHVQIYMCERVGEFTHPLGHGQDKKHGQILAT